MKTKEVPGHVDGYRKSARCKTAQPRWPGGPGACVGRATTVKKLPLLRPRCAVDESRLLGKNGRTRVSPSRSGSERPVTHLTATRVNAFSRIIDFSTVLVDSSCRCDLFRDWTSGSCSIADDFVTGKGAGRVFSVKVRYP